MSYLTAFNSHTAAVQETAATLGIEGCVQLSDYGLRVGCGDFIQLWRARFIAMLGGRLAYTDVRGPGTVGFAGWLPYPPRQWSIATDKIAFKRHAARHGMPTPAACFDPAAIAGPFIIKQASSSFGEGIRGPFRAHEPGRAAHQLQPGEYFENFLVGLIAKAWCWGGECLALHLHKPSAVVGDGVASVRHLAERLPNSRGANDWALVGRLAALCGISSIDDVPVVGKEVLVEFRYGSRYDSPSMENPDVWPAVRGSVFGAQFTRAARVFAQGIGLDPREGNSCYTLDAVVDAEGSAWFLEMNCNPVVHPGLYGAMLRDGFAAVAGENMLQQRVAAVA